MPDQQQYVSQRICTQLLRGLLVIFALGVLVALVGAAGHDFSVVALGLCVAVGLPMVVVHWVVEPAWPDSRRAISVGRPSKLFLVRQVSSRAVAPAAPPPRQFLAL
jgi:hypothetical protein